MRSQSSRRGADEDEAGLGFAWGFGLLQKLAGNPKEGIAVCLALAGAAAVIVNALFLQTGPHPAPIFSTHVAPQRTGDATGSVAPVLPRPRPAEVDVAPQAAPGPAPAPTAQAPARPAHATSGTAPHDDPIALLLAPSKRVLAVQRVLAAFGYGQVSPTGIEDKATTAAVKKFEREHKLPVTGQVNDRFVRALAQATGRSIE